MNSELHDISLAIGELRAEVKNLKDTFLQTNHGAVEHRAAIHRRVDALITEVNDVKSAVDVLAAKATTTDNQMKDVKEVTDEVKMWKQRGVGALFVAGIAGTALGGTAVGFLVYWWDTIIKLLRSVP
jgi:hypothetical protein